MRRLMAVVGASLVSAVAVLPSGLCTSPVGAVSEGVPYPGKPLRAVYLTYWSAASPKRVDHLIGMARDGLINGVVIDLKDVTGRVAFDTTVPEATEHGSKQVIIRDVDGLIERLHAEGMYVIGRVVVFADPILAEARPELAVHSVRKLDEAGGRLSARTLWRDRRGLAWVDPASRVAWRYNVAIAQDAWRRGFDEINFDYIRFPTDGRLDDMRFPVWRGRGSRRETIREFFAYVRAEMSEAVISADLFGLSTVNRDDLGVGQLIEDAFEHFDYVCPMVYPSHYAPGFLGKSNPAEYPYEVVFYSLKGAAERRLAMGDQGRARLRPWLQAFDLGADYTPTMVFAQIQATRDALRSGYRGFVLWNPRNVYAELSAVLSSYRPAESGDLPSSRSSPGNDTVLSAGLRAENREKRCLSPAGPSGESVDYVEMEPEDEEHFCGESGVQRDGR